jgi:hypothetical protein
MTTKRTACTNVPVHPSAVRFDDSPRIALRLLSHAYWLANDTGSDLWDFALEIDRLFEAGLTVSDLRWLVAKGFAEHGEELSVYGSPHRSFRRGDGFFFDHSTCVVLTARGASFVGRFLSEPAESLNSSTAIEVTSSAGGVTAKLHNVASPCHSAEGRLLATIKPCWHSLRRELCLNGQVVKRFRVPARNQESILGAFEEESWPDHIDDPLPVSSDIDPRTRLHDVINRLNRCHTNRSLRFHGNGSGTGVRWRLSPEIALVAYRQPGRAEGNRHQIDTRPTLVR